MSTKGFTIAEIIVAVAIMTLVASVGVVTFVSSKNSANLNSFTDGIISSLEQARSNSASGKGGSSYGIRFATTTLTHTLFIGSTYNASTATNIVTQIGTGYTLSTNLTASSTTIVFSRLTGVPSATGTITLLQQATSKSKVITVGSQGNITVQ
jgi:prepilin-type N-terminal cleavage/methylation domain-containing protein